MVLFCSFFTFSLFSILVLILYLPGGGKCYASYAVPIRQLARFSIMKLDGEDEKVAALENCKEPFGLVTLIAKGNLDFHSLVVFLNASFYFGCFINVL